MTLKKYLGFNTPLAPYVKITLLELIKKSIPSFMAFYKSIWIIKSQLPLIPEITPYSLGMPGAK